MSDPGAELVEVLDRSGAVVDVVPRSRMRAEVLRHRCTYVAVVVRPADAFDAVLGSVGAGLLQAEDQLVVHQRADWKDTYPAYWDLAFGGVCAVGESWTKSAARELAEEAGITGATLVPLGPQDRLLHYQDRDNRVMGRVYLAAWPDEPICADGEVVAVDRVPLGELSRWLSSHPVCPDSAQLVAPLLLQLLPAERA